MIRIYFFTHLHISFIFFPHLYLLIDFLASALIFFQGESLSDIIHKNDGKITNFQNILLHFNLIFFARNLYVLDYYLVRINVVGKLHFFLYFLFFWENFADYLRDLVNKYYVREKGSAKH